LSPAVHQLHELPAWACTLLREAPVARLATANADGDPHLVPICFATGELHLYSAVDRKPKRHRRLERLENLRNRPRACLLVDVYHDDWRRLAWIRVDATAAILEEGDERRRALALLTRKYPQYRDMQLERDAGPVIRLTPDRLSFWRADSSAGGAQE
jgi:PPOX class probable F420-dependent enzyme